MKQKIIWVCVILLVFIGALIFLIFNPQKDSYDRTKEKDLGFEKYLNELNECKTKGITPSFGFCSELPEQEIFDKLEIIKNLRGVEECNNIFDYSKYEECQAIVKGCKIISETSFQPQFINLPIYTSINLYECEDGKQYAVEHSAPSPRIKVYRIQLTEEQISELKNFLKNN